LGIGDALGAAEALPEPLAVDQVRPAAEVALRAFQSDLEHLASPVEPKVARWLMRERFWALSALIRCGRQDGGAEGHKYAKQILLDLTGGAPLTICMGDVCRIRHGERDAVMTTAGYLRFAVKGCFEIFEDDTRTSAEMWPGLCRSCRNKERRNQGRKLRRRVDSMSRDATVYYGRLPPSGRRSR